MSDYDAIFVGSGINCLVASALLARDGWRCAVFERQGHLGGAIHTAELTPGFVHDLYSVSHSLFVASDAYAELEDDLRARGLAYTPGDTPAASITWDDAAALLTTDLEANIREFERHGSGDGATWRRLSEDHQRVADLIRELFAHDLWSRDGLRFGLRAYRRLGRDGLLRFAGEMLETCRDWTARFQSPAVQALLAPWTLHAGAGPDNAGSGFMTRVMTMSLQTRGVVLPVGGGGRLVTALAELIADADGVCVCRQGVRKILVRRGRAVGVQLDDGTLVGARRAVVAGVTPTQLYGQLLEGVPEAATPAAAAKRFRYGRARMQVHMALAERPRWPDERLLDAATVHVTSGVDAVSRAVNEADRGLLPAEPTLTIAQPVAIDPSRAPDGRWIFSIQLHETPWRPVGDAGGAIATGDGTWTPDLADAYADRAQAILSRHVANLDQALLHRVVLSPADIAVANENFMFGDAASGACSLDQSLLWRPRPDLPGHTTAVGDLYHVGASTHPGQGLGAGSGIIVARRLRRGGSRLRLRRRSTEPAGFPAP